MKGDYSKETPINKDGKINRQKLGKLSRARGARFELRTRKDLEGLGWTVSKWMNNVDLEEGKLIQSKQKYNPFARAFRTATGFPDFICFKKLKNNFEVILLEVKRTGMLDKEEKLKCQWYLENNIVDKILIAIEERVKNKIIVKYVDFKEKYPKYNN